MDLWYHKLKTRNYIIMKLPIKSNVFSYKTLIKEQLQNDLLTNMTFKFDVYYKILFTSKENIQYQWII